jgi:hypothetical protein
MWNRWRRLGARPVTQSLVLDVDVSDIFRTTPPKLPCLIIIKIPCDQETCRNFIFWESISLPCWFCIPTASLSIGLGVFELHILGLSPLSTLGLFQWTHLAAEAAREDPQALPGVEDQPRGGRQNLEVSPSPMKPWGKFSKSHGLSSCFSLKRCRCKSAILGQTHIYILSVVYVISCRSDPIISHWNPIRFPWNPVKLPFWQVKSQFITPVRLVISLCWLSISGSGSGAWFVYLIQCNFDEFLSLHSLLIIFSIYI